MNLDELRSVQSKERQKDSLQNLRPSFYQEVGDYIADLEAERDRAAERADDPFSAPEVGRLTDEIETAKDVVEAIYERRMGKLVKQASLAAAGMPADDEGLTAEEADLFDDLVERIGSNKTRVLDVLEGLETATPDSGADAPESDADSQPGGPSSGRSPADDSPPAAPDERPVDTDSVAGEDPQADASSGVSPADVMGGDGPSIGGAGGDDGGPAPKSTDAGSVQSTDHSNVDDRDDSNAVPGSDPATGSDSVSAASGADQHDGEQADDIDRATVRITSDIGAILGVDDREYTLASDDVVTLPEQNAAPLVEREAAERLE
ncbi:hypothetical protein HYG81_01140 [Natrinema zhouii]|uniref:Gins51 C-terminal domain-containing protein n=1 Tax=Natrinema zhouii TaxID=1710539 RepID=A0A7D6CP85_9EURY|nr:hypothetical protein [Natrinema zhouii]QLK26258.1 hypothetical protein HYG81_01140 [Natrinema zhouii]